MTYYEEFCIFLHFLVSLASKLSPGKEEASAPIFFIYLYTVALDSTHTLARTDTFLRGIVDFLHAGIGKSLLPIGVIDEPLHFVPGQQIKAHIANGGQDMIVHHAFQTVIAGGFQFLKLIGFEPVKKGIPHGVAHR